MDKYWEGAAVFPATGTEVEYFVDAGPDGVPDANRRSFATIKTGIRVDFFLRRKAGGSRGSESNFSVES